MSDKTILEIIGKVPDSKAMYFNAAAASNDPLERMKHVITASYAYLYPCHMWDKPLSPILGETYQASLEDGTQIFTE